MKGLGTLVRMHRSRLDETKVRLVALENLREDLFRRRHSLGDELARESAYTKSSPEPAWSYTAYRESMEARRDRLSDSIAEVENEISAVKDAMAAAFREYKKHELVLEHRMREEQSVEERRSRIVEDEIGIEIYRRRPSVTP